MSVKVCKFGGSSLASSAQVRKVAAIIQSEAARRFVVPSAPGRRDKHDQKVTDLLYLCHEHARQDLPFEEVFTRIRERFVEMVAGLGLSLDIGSTLDEVEAGIREAAASGKGADYAASRGEFLNGQVLAAELGFTFVDAAEMIFFNDHSRLDSERTYAALAARLSDTSCGYVVPGFYGSMPDGSVKTFSRGGSDVTGSIIARGVGADVYENWTDVSGVLMTDPRIVENPPTIEVITYRELRELAYMGATVLHDEADDSALRVAVIIDRPLQLVLADTLQLGTLLERRLPQLAQLCRQQQHPPRLVLCKLHHHVDEDPLGLVRVDGPRDVVTRHPNINSVLAELRHLHAAERLRGEGYVRQEGGSARL